MRSCRTDGDRGVSEVAGVAIMIGFTLLVVASVGVSVLFVDTGEAGPPSANFTFEHFSENSILLVTHAKGDAIPADRLVLEGPPGSLTWADLDTNKNGTDPVEPDDVVQLSRNSAWNDGVTSNEKVEIYYVPDPDNRTLLDAWRGG